mgnify:CR=1 FL=1
MEIDTMSFASSSPMELWPMHNTINRIAAELATLISLSTRSYIESAGLDAFIVPSLDQINSSAKRQGQVHPEYGLLAEVFELLPICYPSMMHSSRHF